MSQELENHKGVKQGCILSPLLFNIFLSDLPKSLNPDNQAIIHENVGVNCLIWVDDFLLLSESEGGLQSMLNHLSTYCKANGLEINKNKTKCMIFNKTGRLLRRKFYFARDKLENVRSYKYLGLIFTPLGELKTALSDLRSRALKAYMNLRDKLGKHFNTC